MKKNGYDGFDKLPSCTKEPSRFVCHSREATTIESLSSVEITKLICGKDFCDILLSCLGFEEGSKNTGRLVSYSFWVSLEWIYCRTNPKVVLYRKDKVHTVSFQR